MAKPFAKLQVGYRNHPKFAHLNANAFSLWHEAKDYCAEFLTDGLLPAAQVKQFRFYGKKAVELLMAPCGLTNSDGTPMASLWERCEVGYRMHDYLDHNDCREAVLERIGKAEERRKEGNERVKAFRDRKRAEEADRNAPVTHSVTRYERVTNAPVTPSTATATSTSVLKPKEQVSEREPARAPIHARPRLDATWNGPRGLYVMPSQHMRFVAARNGNEAEVFEFYQRTAESWGHGEHRTSNIDPDMFKFWTARATEYWPPLRPEKAERGVPTWAQ